MRNQNTESVAVKVPLEGRNSNLLKACAAERRRRKFRRGFEIIRRLIDEAIESEGKLA